MEATTIVAIVLTLSAAALVAFLGFRSVGTGGHDAQARQIAEFRELEKRLHLRERDFLAERNEIEIKHAEAIKAARAESFEEGRLLGQREGSATKNAELSEQRRLMLKSIEEERAIAADEAREQLRAQYALQAKLFAVNVSPYVSIREERKLLRHRYETITGYQYQLLVNGIPAFTPHIVIEHTELKDSINPQIEQLLIEKATKAAEAAIGLYLGGGTQFAKLTGPILRKFGLSKA